MNQDITQHALLINLTISQWSGRKFDKQASTDVEAEADASAGRARVNKLLISKEALLPTQQAAAALRNMVYTQTLPWGDNGDRVLLAENFFDFSNGLRGLKDAFEAAADQLARDYYAEKERARFELNALFKESDYPAADDIRKKFGVKFAVRPLPSADDFRVTLPADQLAEIRAEMEESLNATKEAAMRGVWESIGTMLCEVRNRMAEPEPRFRRALIDNLVDLTDRLAILNIAGDRQLAELRSELRRCVTVYDAEDLRGDKAVREAFVSEADVIIRDFGAMWGAV